VDLDESLAVLGTWHAYGVNDQILEIGNQDVVTSTELGKITRHFDFEHQSNVDMTLSVLDNYRTMQTVQLLGTSDTDVYKVDYPGLACTLQVLYPAANCTNKVLEWKCSGKHVANATFTSMLPAALDLMGTGYGTFLPPTYFFATASALLGVRRDLANCALKRLPVSQEPLRISPYEWRCYKLFGNSYTPVRLSERNEVQCLGTPGGCAWSPVAAFCNEKIDQQAQLKPFSCGAFHLKKYGAVGYDKNGHWCKSAEEKILRAEEPLRAIKQALKSVESNLKMCLDNTMNVDDAALSKIWPCHGHRAQQWTYRNGELKNANGLCLDVWTGWTSIVGIVGTYQCNGGNNQKWDYDPQTKRLKSRGSNKCLGTLSGVVKRDSQPIIVTCSDHPTQKWEFH
jgi:hypothetical protein